MQTLVHDVRHAFRVLRRSPGFTAVSVLTLALAIGATTAIFSVVYGVLLRPLPYNDPDRIMAIHEVNSRGTWSRLADPNFDDFRDQNHTLQAIGIQRKRHIGFRRFAADAYDGRRSHSRVPQSLPSPALYWTRLRGY